MNKVEEAFVALSDERLLKANLICEVCITSVDFKFENEVQDIVYTSTILRKPGNSRTIINLTGDVVGATGESIGSIMSTPMSSRRKFMLIEVKDEIDETFI